MNLKADQVPNARIPHFKTKINNPVQFAFPWCRKFYPLWYLPEAPPVFIQSINETLLQPRPANSPVAANEFNFNQKQNWNIIYVIGAGAAVGQRREWIVLQASCAVHVHSKAQLEVNERRNSQRYCC